MEGFGMSKWQEVSMGDVAEFVTDKIAASSVTLENYISTDNMQVDRGGVVKATNLPNASKFNHYKETDTLFSNIRTYFKKVWLADRDGGASADVLIFRSKDEKKLNPLYLYYLLSGNEFIEFTVLTSKGAKMPRGDKDAMKQFKLFLPSPDEQIEIVESLRCIDQKIELNQRMNETLEGMARSIFKSWFVDFDPVHAKAEGRPPTGMDKSTATLFPDTFNDEGIPEGWEEKPLGDIADILNGYAFKSDDYQEEGLRILRTKNFSEKGYAEVLSDDVFVPNKFWDDYQKYRCELFDFHLVMVGASVGKTSYALSNMLPCLRNQNMWCFRPKIKETRFFVNLATEKKVFDVMGWADGSARTFFKKGDFNKHVVIYPNNELAQKFSYLVEPLFQQYNMNVKQNQNLAALRDTLLPKLISGDLRVEDTATHLRRQYDGKLV